MNNAVKITLAISLFFLLGGGIFLLSYNSSREGQERTIAEKFTSAFTEGVILLEASDGQATGKLEEALNLAGRFSVDEGRARIYLWSSYKYTDPKRGIDILKDIAENEEYDDFLRSVAIIHIADTYIIHKDQEIVEHIFTGKEPWASLGGGGDTDTSILKLYEWGNDIYPTALSHYRIAGWYRHWLGENLFNPRLSDAQKEKYLALLKDHTQKGDALLEPAIASQFDPYAQAGLFSTRAKDYAALYFYERNEEYKLKAEKSYRRSLNLLLNSEAPYAANVRLFSAYEYGGFLSWLTLKGIEDRTSDVSGLITFIIQADRSFPFFSVLGSHALSSYSSTVQARMIITVDKRLQSLLEELGVELEPFEEF